jgi:hypothetical protein
VPWRGRGSAGNDSEFSFAVVVNKMERSPAAVNLIRRTPQPAFGKPFHDLLNGFQSLMRAYALQHRALVVVESNLGTDFSHIESGSWFAGGGLRLSASLFDNGVVNVGEERRSLAHDELSQ